MKVHIYILITMFLQVYDLIYKLIEQIAFMFNTHICIYDNKYLNIYVTIFLQVYDLIYKLIEQKVFMFNIHICISMESHIYT
jgi:hypothetical protein